MQERMFGKAFVTTDITFNLWNSYMWLMLRCSNRRWHDVDTLLLDSMTYDLVVNFFLCIKTSHFQFVKWQMHVVPHMVVYHQYASHTVIIDVKMYRQCVISFDCFKLNGITCVEMRQTAHAIPRHDKMSMIYNQKCRITFCLPFISEYEATKKTASKSCHLFTWCDPTASVSW